MDVFRVPSDGGGALERIFSGPDTQVPQAWAADGRLLVQEDRLGRGQHLAVLSFGMDSVTASPYLLESGNQRGPALSPDGRWVAYSSDETRREEVYVSPYPDVQGGRWQVSERGGQEPAWSTDGRTLYYWEGPDLRAAAVQTGPTFKVVGRETVLSGSRGPEVPGFRQWDVHPDGDRFVIVRSVGAAEGETATSSLTERDRFTIAVNWFEELGERMGAARARPGG